MHVNSQPKYGALEIIYSMHRSHELRGPRLGCLPETCIYRATGAQTLEVDLESSTQRLRIQKTRTLWRSVIFLRFCFCSSAECATGARLRRISMQVIPFQGEFVGNAPRIDWVLER
jgi:hypothetical protein